jgi:hypothetical protein
MTPGMGLRRVVGWSAAAAALAAVFAAYLRPDFVFAMAAQAWACF